ncbi:DUF3102 domain-containing protein [Paenibacillus taichungensis]|uniref:DUF3102 domain-containing protein n=1 Tax=Paenibacillus taichungensis TaxID=484184 RepID=UPI002DBB913E|nr:DUF3102 domain-containing protein [Paenibacillus taichungensis]MEC0107246.1 DUF3102 domain-containing protein [Paenibacillus taichungensis]MEC0194822.1 DUF3102 domain-containing protein [Paenibacillus taichungensis]
MAPRKKIEKEEVTTTEVVPTTEKAVASRTPDVIAAEIRSIDKQVRENMIDIGLRLIEAKGLVKRGEWGQWLSINVNYSHSTANNLMKIAAEFSKSETLIKLEYSQAVEVLSLPADQREGFVEENNVSEMSVRELKAAIKAQQEAERKLAEEQERANAAEAARAEEERQREVLRGQYQNLLEERQKLESELAAAQEEAKKPSKATGPDAKTKTELRKAEKDLSETQQRLSALEEEMKAKEDEMSAKVDAAIKEREQELAEQARKREEESAKQVAELQEQLRKNNNTAAIKVKVHFESLLNDFNSLVGSIAELDNEEQKKAISDRVSQLCDEMKAKL